MMDFPNFLEKKYLEWQQREGKRMSVGQFAKYLGVGQSTVSMWWNGVNTPRDDKIDLLAAKLGPEVYDVLGMERPDPLLMAATQHWENIPGEVKQKVADLIAPYITTNHENQDHLARSRQHQK